MAPPFPSAEDAGDADDVQAEPPQPLDDRRQPRPPITGTAAALPLPEAYALLTSFTSFLTVAIHTILYHRALYPPATFLSARAFNLPVHQNRHPRVCAWIRDAVAAVSAQLAAGAAERVALVIHAPLAPAPVRPPTAAEAEAADKSTSTSASMGSAPAPGAVLERWLFDVGGVPAWPGGAEAMRRFEAAAEGGEEGGGGDEDEEDGGDEDGDDGSEDGGARAGAVNFADVGEQLRGVVKRLGQAGDALGALPEGCTFTIAVELRDEGEAPIGHPQPWIPSQPNLQPASRSNPRGGRDISDASITPIRSAQAGPLFFECWVEEGKAKEALKTTPRSIGTKLSLS